MSVADNVFAPDKEICGFGEVAIDSLNVAVIVKAVPDLYFPPVGE